MHPDVKRHVANTAKLSFNPINLQQPADKPLKTSNRQLACDHDTNTTDDPSQNNLFQNTLTLDTKNNNNKMDAHGNMPTHPRAVDVRPKIISLRS